MEALACSETAVGYVASCGCRLAIDARGQRVWQGCAERRRLERHAAGLRALSAQRVLPAAEVREVRDQLDAVRRHEARCFAQWPAVLT